MSEAKLHHNVVLAICAVLVACGQGGSAENFRQDEPTMPSSAEAVAALLQADYALQAAIERRDVDATVAFYAPDATLLPAAAPAIDGTDAIRAEWTSLFAIPAFQNAGEMTSHSVSSSADMAFTRGTYATTLTGHEGELLIERGKWVTIWRREPEGSWRIVVDIYNTDTPPPDHQ